MILRHGAVVIGVTHDVDDGLFHRQPDLQRHRHVRRHVGGTHQPFDDFRTSVQNLRIEVAKMMYFCRRFIGDIENESRNKHLTIAVLGRIADAMNIHIVNFFIEDDETKMKGE